MASPLKAPLQTNPLELFSYSSNFFGLTLLLDLMRGCQSAREADEMTFARLTFQLLLTAAEDKFEIYFNYFAGEGMILSVIWVMIITEIIWFKLIGN